MALKTSLIGCWELSDANDSHTNALHMSAVNSPAYVAGKLGNCLDTAAGFLDHADDALLSPTAACSIALWIKGGGDLRGVCGSTDNSGKSIAVIRWTDNDFRLYLGSANYAYASSPDVTNGTSWWHVVWVYDGAGATDADKVKCYVNGAASTLSFSGTIPTSLPDPTSRFALGRGLNGSGFSPMNGFLDQVAFWSRAISGAEAAEIYNAGSGLAYSSWDAASSAIKTINGLACASIKTVNGLAVASMKTFNGLA